MPGWRTWISLEDKEHAQELLFEQHSYRHELQRDSRHDFATKLTGPASYSFKQTPSSRRPSSAALGGWKLDELKLSIRIRTLTHCGAVHDSDENTAKNIRAEGIRPCRTTELFVLWREGNALRLKAR